MLRFILHPRFPFFLLLLTLLFSSACNKKKEFSTTEVDASLSSYIYAYTSGTVSKNSAIRVQFTENVIDAEAVGQEADPELLALSPSVKGSPVWEDTRTLSFLPEEGLKSGEIYTAKVDLHPFFNNLSPTNRYFRFEFKVRDQFFEVDIKGLQAQNPTDLSRQQILGSLVTSDAAENKEVEDILKASQNGEPLDISWQHVEDQTTHYFTIEGVMRGEKPSKVKISWDGSPLKVKLKSERTLEVPSINDFFVSSVRVVQQGDPHFKIQFSDPIEAGQDLEGLISLQGYSGDLRFVIDGQIVRAYPSVSPNGKQKLRISRGIRNTMGKRMPQSSEWDVLFEEPQPELRTVGNGIIVPKSDGLLFPFEAIGLNYIEVEVHKIYSSNILQFLQVNDLPDNYELNRVGHMLLQKRVSLRKLNPDAAADSWTRYALDLADLIEQDPQAVYQVTIGFRPGYAVNNCPELPQIEEDDLKILSAAQEDEDPRSIWGGYYGVEGYYQGYQWNDREDPCKPAYYNYQRFIRRNVLSSNLGIVAKSNENHEFTLAVTDLRTTAPLSGVRLEFYDYQQQLLETVTTDNDGMALASLEKSPFVLVAKRGEERGYLKLLDQNALSLSRFDVSGSRPQKGMKGFLYAERGVWRPGDSIYLNFILEDPDNRLPQDYPVTLEVSDPRGQVKHKLVAGRHTNRVYPFHLATDPEAPTGNWRAVVRAGGAQFSKTLKVETVKPNRLKIRLDFGRDELRQGDEQLAGELQVNWLHGAPARNLKTVIEAQASRTNTTFEGYEPFEFDDPASRSGQTSPKVIFDGQVDAQGKAQVQADLSGLARSAGGKQRINFRLRAFEKGGDFSTDQFSMPYSPFPAYAGINIPTERYGYQRLNIGEKETLEFVVVSEDGEPLANEEISVGLYRLNWRWWWERDEDNVYRFNSTGHQDAQNKVTLTTDAQGKARWDVAVQDWGRYMVRACVTSSGHCSGDYFYAGYPWYGEDGSGRQAAAMLGFVSDKETYNVGELIELIIPTGESGRCLITLETGSEVLAHYWMDAKKGENKYSIEATEEMAPTVYAHVTLLQPHNQVQNDLPIRMYGVIPLRVEDPATRLQPELKMPDKLEPEQTFTVQVSEAADRPMAYTVAIVDEGLLDLTRFQTPNPWDAFYAREALGIKTWDIYDYVLGAYGGELERVLSIGGDGAAVNPAAKKKVNRFKPVVLHAGPFYLEKGEKVEHEFTLPNYVGSVRAMVVAADQGAYGNTEKTVPVKKPLMVLATLPRVLGPQEKLQLPVNVFAMEDHVKNVVVEVEEKTGLVSFPNGNSREISFEQTGDDLIYVDFDVRERVGVARFTVTARSGKEKASQEIEIEVRNPNPYITKVIDKAMDEGENWEPTFTLLGVEGTNEAMLEVSNIPPIDLGRRLRYLTRYPHGCVEQVTSAVFPQLYLTSLLKIDEEGKKHITKNILGGIDKLKNYQNSSGGFSYWPGNSASPWGSTYAGHFLLEAKEKGYTVPSGMIERWVRYQKKAATRWDNDFEESHWQSNQLSQAYRLYALALAGEPALGAMNRLRENSKLSTTARWRLAAAYALAGKPEVARELIAGLGTQVPPYNELGLTYGSDLRDQAMILETLLLLGDKDQAAELSRVISQKISDSRWYSTQTVAYCLLAIGKLVGESEVDDQFTVEYAYGGGSIERVGSTLPLYQAELPVDSRSDHSLSVKNTSSGLLFARVILSGQPLVGDVSQAENNDLEISVNYTDMDGKEINPARLPQGTDFLASVTIQNPGTRSTYYREIVLSQIFPSGWEIINSRLSNISNFRNSPYDYRDIRDDRVYTYFDIGQKPYTYKVQLNAAYQGRFYQPTLSCEAMYDDAIYARRPGRWVEVTPAAGVAAANQ